MNNNGARYLILDGQNGQPFAALRVRLVAGNPNVDTFVAVMTEDLRSAGVETITHARHLTPEASTFATFAHPSALVVFA